MYICISKILYTYIYIVTVCIYIYMYIYIYTLIYHIYVYISHHPNIMSHLLHVYIMENLPLAGRKSPKWSNLGQVIGVAFGYGDQPGGRHGFSDLQRFNVIRKHKSCLLETPSFGTSPISRTKSAKVLKPGASYPGYPGIMVTWSDCQLHQKDSFPVASRKNRATQNPQMSRPRTT